MSWETITPLLAALLGGATIPQLIKVISGWFSGRTQREASAWEQRDAEARRRRKLQESLHEHRTAWHRETGRAFEDMPDWPT